MQAENGTALQDDEAQALLDAFDLNADGELQFEEFAIMWGAVKDAFVETPPSSVEEVAGAKRQVHLWSEAELLNAARLEHSAFEEVERRASASVSSTFLRRLGLALMQHDVALRAQKGSKDALSALLRSWDTNKDGSLNKVELRQAVRGPRLRLKGESNADIDALFNTFDEDGSDEIELTEMKPFLQKLQREAQAAQEEAEAIRAEASECEAASQQLSLAASAMREIETLEAHRREFWAEQHVGLRLMATIEMRKIKIKVRERDAAVGRGSPVAPL